MAPKAKKEVPAPHKAKAKARGKSLKANKALLKGIHSHKTKDPHATHLLKAQDTASPKTVQISSKEHPQEKQA